MTSKILLASMLERVIRFRCKIFEEFSTGCHLIIGGNEIGSPKMFPLVVIGGPLVATGGL